MLNNSPTRVICETAKKLTTEKRELAQVSPIGAEARRYALKELSRRAGVAREWFETWIVEVAANRTTILFGAERRFKIHFPHADEDTLEKIARGNIPVARAKYFREAGDLAERELILPFCDDQSGSASPLY